MFLLFSKNLYHLSFLHLQKMRKKYNTESFLKAFLIYAFHLVVQEFFWLGFPKTLYTNVICCHLRQYKVKKIENQE